MEKSYKEDINMWALDTDKNHILHKIGSDDYTELRHATVKDPSLWEEIAVEEIPPYTEAQYSAKVAELVHERYSLDDEIALINNMRDGDVTEKRRTEYAEYQQYRTECKVKAKELLLSNSNNGHNYN